MNNEHVICPICFGLYDSYDFDFDFENKYCEHSSGDLFRYFNKYVSCLAPLLPHVRITYV